MSEPLRKVSTGFKLVYYGLVLVVLAVIIGIVGMAVLVGAAVGGAAGGGGGGGGGGAGGAVAGGAVGLLLVVGGMAIIGSIVGLVGRFHCLAIPDDAGSAKPMIVTSVVLEVISLLSSIVNTADNAGGNFIPAQVKMVTGAMGTIFSIVAAILFLLFIRSAAEYIRRPKLGDKAMSVLWLWVGTVGCYIAGVVVAVAGFAAAGAAGGGAGGGGAGGGAGGAAGAGAAAGGCIGGILMLVALVLGLVALVKYARLLTEMSKATLRFADKMGDYEEEDEGDEEEEDEDRPRRRSRRDEEDDEDDRPRKKKGGDDW